MKKQKDGECWWLLAPGLGLAGLSVPKNHQGMSANTRVLNSEETANVPAVPKYDGAKQRASEWPFSSVMSLDLRGFVHSAPLLPLRVFQQPPPWLG